MTSYEAISLWIMMTTLSSSSVVKEQELPKSFIDISARRRVSGMPRTACHPKLFYRERRLVEVSGLEPLTPCVQSRCSPI